MLLRLNNKQRLSSFSCKSNPIRGSIHNSNEFGVDWVRKLTQPIWVERADWVGLKFYEPDMIGLGWVKRANPSNPTRAQPYSPSS